MLIAFFQEHWPSILLSLVSAGALAFCKHLWSELKNYKKLLDEKNIEAMNLGKNYKE